MALTFNGTQSGVIPTGDETDVSMYSGTPPAGASPLSTEEVMTNGVNVPRVVDLDAGVGNMTEVFDNTGNQVYGGTVTVSGDALVDFLNGRLTAGGDHAGLATFIIDQPVTGQNRGYGFATREADAALQPMLHLSYVPEPSSFGLVMIGLSLIGIVNRKSGLR
jgi:hypothetical protein